MTTLAKTFAFTLAAAGLAGAAITPALAAPAGPAPAERMTMSIATADLDLDTPAGQRTLDRRINAAARQVCRTISVRTGTRIVDAEATNCLAKARAEAKQQVASLMNAERRGG